MSLTLFEKIWNEHIVREEKGYPTIFAIDFMLLHEVTSAQAFDTIRERGIPLFDKDRLLATLDHSIPTRKNRLKIFNESARIQVDTLRKNVKEFNIPFYDYGKGQGIVHVIGPEYGLTQPGMTIVCGDSHTSTHGAFGALSFGIGTSEVATVLATGCLLQKKPKTMRVEFRGSFNPGVYAKDAILKLIQTIGIGGANGHVIEYTGEAIRNMRMDERMTICNMSIECGARAGLIAPDEITFEYLKEKRFSPKNDKWQEACNYWNSLKSDTGCKYDTEVTINLNNLKPIVTWGTNPEEGLEIDQTIPKLSDLSQEKKTSLEKSLSYMGLTAGKKIEGTKIQWAFLGSCTNGRIEDLRIAAEILKGNKVHKNVTFYVVPGSETVREQAIKEGLDKIFKTAGADFRMPGCSMCLGMNDDKVPAKERCISSSNRNFIGRQGPGSRTHLASPATVAASAIEGKIINCEKYLS